MTGSLACVSAGAVGGAHPEARGTCVPSHRGAGALAAVSGTMPMPVSHRDGILGWPAFPPTEEQTVKGLVVRGCHLLMEV